MAVNQLRISGALRGFCVARTVLLVLSLSVAAVRGQVLTRSEAVAALLNPGSGVNVDFNLSTVWSPFVDYGSGPGFEGLLPAGSAAEPFELGWLPFPGPGMVAAAPSYFFWIDDEPAAQFQHPTRFVFVQADIPQPTVANGGIVVTAQGWWPVVTPASGSPREFFRNFGDIATSEPAGPTNPKGLIAGSTLAPGDDGAGGDGLDLRAGGGSEAWLSGNACGLILIGDGRFDFRADVPRFESDLINHYGVASNRIVKANGGNPASSADLTAAITTLCAQQPPCDKIFVRLSSHGSQGGFSLTDGTIAATNLCNQLKKLADKGVPVCLMINACYSGSLLDPHNWNLPAGSVIMTSTDSNHTGFGWTYFDGTNRFTGSIFPYAYSQCLNANPTNNPGLDRNGDGFVDDPEAQRWVRMVQPCYALVDATNTMRYPAGTGTNAGPNPQIRTVGTDPRSINLNVCNGSGTPKTDFHIVFQGNVTNGIPLAWRSDADDHISTPWGPNRTVTYDPVRNETTVSWEDPGSPVQPNQYIHFGYSPAGGGLRPLRQHWTPTAIVPAPQDRVPAQQSSVLPGTNDNQRIIRLISHGDAFDGFGGLQFGGIMVRYSPVPIPLDHLNLNDPLVTNAPPIFFGTFFLNPDMPFEIPVTVPMLPSDPSPSLIVTRQSQWEVNQTATIQIELVALSLQSVAPRPTLSITASNNLITVDWVVLPNYVLESAPTATGPWSEYPIAGPPLQFTPGPEEVEGYFRLHWMPTPGVP